MFTHRCCLLTGACLLTGVHQAVLFTHRRLLTNWCLFTYREPWRSTSQEVNAPPGGQRTKRSTPQEVNASEANGWRSTRQEVNKSLPLKCSLELYLVPLLDLSEKLLTQIYVLLCFCFASALLCFAFALLVLCLCCCFHSNVPCFCLILLCFWFCFEFLMVLILLSF